MKLLNEEEKKLVADAKIAASIIQRVHEQNQELIKLLREHGIAIPKHLTGEVK